MIEFYISAVIGRFSKKLKFVDFTKPLEKLHVLLDSGKDNGYFT